jgi:hypothetical protein
MRKILKTVRECFNPQGTPIFLAAAIGFLLATLASVWLRY